MYEDSWSGKDFYGTLGVSKTADMAEIKKAYRKAARKYHPDTNSEPGAEDKFKDASVAYEVLSDESKRKSYDSGPGLGGLGGFDFSNFDFSNFGTATEGGEGPSYEDFKTTKMPSFSDMFSGDEFKDLRDTLSRTGFKGFDGESDSMDADVREESLGARAQARMGNLGESLNGMFQTAKTSVQDRINNATPKEAVQAVDVTFTEAADGTVKTVETPTGDVEVRIPAGIKDGQKLRANGTMFSVTVGADKVFSREGNNLVVNLPVSLLEAVEGGVKKMTLPGHGGVAFRLKPGCSNTASLLRGKGFNGGDAIIKPFIKLPDAMNESHLAAAYAFNKA